MLKIDNVVELRSRQKIYDTIKRYPGLHLRELIRKVDYSNGTVRYHLKYLKKRDLIIEKTQDNYVRYFLSNEISTIEKELMGFMRQKIPRYIIINILFNMAASRAKISSDLEKSPEVVGYHLQRLYDAGIIKKAKVENGYVNFNKQKVKHKEYNAKTSEVVYILSDYPKINDFFIVKKDWFEDAITAELIKYSIELEKNKHPKKLKSFESSLDEIIEILKDIFYNPYWH